MDQLLEIWKNIEGYEGKYQMSSEGNVKSLNYNHTGTERILKPIKDRDGYLQVTLCKDGKKKTYTVHRLVAQTFIPNPNSLPCVNHKDERVDNNRVENLEWCTIEYNNNYGTHNAKVAKSMSKPILQLTLSGKLVREWPSAIEAVQQGGFNNTHISACCSGKRNIHKGFIWRFKD